MKVRVLKECFSVSLNRRVAPGELVEVSTIPWQAIEEGKVELEHPDFGIPDKPREKQQC